MFYVIKNEMHKHLNKLVSISISELGRCFDGLSKKVIKVLPQIGGVAKEANVEALPDEFQ